MSKAVEMAALVAENEALRRALILAVERPIPHRGRWHQQDPHGHDCVGCQIEDALALGDPAHWRNHDRLDAT